MRHVSKDLIKRVHEKITRCGKPVDHYYHFLGGLYAHHSGDGFIISVSDTYNLVKLSFDTDLQYVSVSDDSQNLFLRKVKRLDQKF